MTEYRLKTVGEGAARGHALALVPTEVIVVKEHFGVRRIYQPHPAGEGLWMQNFVVDHMPSGFRAHGGNYIDGCSLQEAIVVAKSAATAPIDWSSAEPEPDREAVDFIHAAKAAAGSHRILRFDDWKRGAK